MVLLINPPASKGKYGRGQFFTPPMGLAYIASSLKRSEIDVEIIDCDPANLHIDYFKPKVKSIQKFIERLRKVNTEPMVIGIGPCTTPFIANALAIAKNAKSYFPSALVLLGGPHVSIDSPVMAERMLREYDFIDGIVIGEGEITITQIASAINNNQNIHTVAGVVFRMDSHFSYTERAPLSKKEFEHLPFPARDLIQEYSGKYKLALRRTFSKIVSDPVLLKKYGSAPPFSVIFSSRGCPYECSFCCSSKLRKLRSPESVVNEIEECINNYNTYCFVFYDDLFTTASKLEAERVVRICDLIERLDTEILWEVEIRADVIYKLPLDVLKHMNKAGCCIVNMGIEKGTDSGLQYLKKGMTKSIIKQAVDKLRLAGNFTVNGTFILGGEHESIADIKETIEFASSLSIDYASFYLLEIHPGTEIFNAGMKAGLVNDILTPYINSSKKYPIFTNDELDIETLRDLQLLAYQTFYLDKKKLCELYSKLKSVDVLSDQYHHFFEHCFIRGAR